MASGVGGGRRSDNHDVLMGYGLTVSCSCQVDPQASGSGTEEEDKNICPAKGGETRTVRESK